MENYLVSWQWDDDGDAGLVKCMSFETWDEASEFLWEQKAGVIRDIGTGTECVWVNPKFTGTVAKHLLR